MSRLAGAASVTIDGVSHMIVGEGTYRLSSFRRESQTGQSGYHGYSEMAQPGGISWKGRDASNESIAALNAMTNGTIVYQAANGKTIIGRNMVRVGDPIAVNTEDGTFTLEAEGPDVSEH